MKKINIITLKLIEITIYIFTFFIILYDIILPRNLSNYIYDFGTAKLSLIFLSPLVIAYVLVGLQEKEYISKKFTKKHQNEVSTVEVY